MCCNGDFGSVWFGCLCVSWGLCQRLIIMSANSCTGHLEKKWTPCQHSPVGDLCLHKNTNESKVVVVKIIFHLSCQPIELDGFFWKSVNEWPHLHFNFFFFFWGVGILDQVTEQVVWYWIKDSVVSGLCKAFAKDSIQSMQQDDLLWGAAEKRERIHCMQVLD